MVTRFKVNRINLPRQSVAQPRPDSHNDTLVKLFLH
jgi:hypothetical protein